jgi:hypothetical protein
MDGKSEDIFKVHKENQERGHNKLSETETFDEKLTKNDRMRWYGRVLRMNEDRIRH